MATRSSFASIEQLCDTQVEVNVIPQVDMQPIILKTTILTIIITTLLNLACAEDIPTNILLRPALILHDKYYVVSKAQLSATAEINSEKFRNSSLKYQWATKTGTLVTGTNASQINCTFDKPDDDTFLNLLVVQVGNETNNHGTSRKNLAVRDPVAISDPIGKLFILHGELLSITLRWTGTGPFKICFRICAESFKKFCNDCELLFETSEPEYKIDRYLRSGNHTLLFKVDNLASASDKHYSIRVESTYRPQKVPYVPIVSSISAVLILFSGVALHLKFKKTVDMETANFEFLEIIHDEDELLEGDTFWQRVCHLLKRPSTYIP